MEVAVAAVMVHQPPQGITLQMTRMPTPHLERDRTGPGTLMSPMMMMKTYTYIAIQGEEDRATATTTMLMRAQG